MSDTPTPPEASGDAPTREPLAPEASRPRRAWTILGRLSQAVREQNWFAVALEIAIVVIGVVIGFQVTGWGQAHADRAQEQTYLRQLASDLRETEQRVARVDSAVERRQYPAANNLLQSWGMEPRPPRDSVLTWVRGITSSDDFSPVLGAVEALVATGDLTLIRNETLRTRITTYLEESRSTMITYGHSNELLRNAFPQLSERIDFLEPRLVWPDSLREALAQQALIPANVPTGEWSTPFPIDVDAFYADHQAYSAVLIQSFVHEAMGRARGGIQARAAALREEVEAELNR